MDPPSPTDGPGTAVVSRFEANLLRLLYFFLGGERAENALPLLEAHSLAPACLSRQAVRLVQDALARGCALLLSRRGGWRRESHLRGGRVVTGRLWERTPPAELGLRFSRHSLAFLIRLTAGRPAKKEPPWRPDPGELTPGDWLLFFFAHEGLSQAPADSRAAALRRRWPFAGHGLCHLAHPEDFADVAPDLVPWTTGVGACVLEALQPELAERWLEVEAGKGRISDPAAMRALGDSQDQVLTAFLDAVEAAGRLDLARFLLRAASRLLRPGAEVAQWVGAMQTQGQRLADRAWTSRAALVFLRHLGRLHDWQRRAQAVGYFDEGYHAAQSWKADWEAHDGDRLWEIARELSRRADPLQG